MTQQDVHALAVMLADTIYVTFTHTADGLSGIKTLEEAFTEDKQRQGFLTAIQFTTGLPFDNIRGTIVVKGSGPVSKAIEQFSTCAFRLKADGPIYAARFLKRRGMAFRQELSVFALTDKDDALIVKHREWIDQGKSDDSFPVTYEELVKATLQPVLSAVAITAAEIGGNQGDASENYGNGQI